jgi:hypothetical protein
MSNIRHEFIPVSEIEGLENNPRYIKEAEFYKLKADIKEDANFLYQRPPLLNRTGGKYICYAGNQRLRAAIELGLTEIPCFVEDDVPQSVQDKRTIIDNTHRGQWDYDLLANEWNQDDLTEWGVVFDKEKAENDIYSRKIESPIYTPKKDVKPELDDIVNLEKYHELLAQIEASKISKKDKELLKLAATRHIKFSYQDIAEYYCHSSKDVQELMENSALIIIDYNKAIELGFVEMVKNTINLQEDGE